MNEPRCVGKTGVGMIGVGVISKQYFASLERLPSLKLVAVADINEARAAVIAAEHGVEARPVDVLLSSDDVDAVINLTIPAAHVEVGLSALAAGKHVFAEKPLGLTTAEARLLIEAQADGLRVGSAPDTVLGTGIQTARRIIDDQAIGEVLGASVHWTAPGHELWHPEPGFYYQPGGGPLYDMGPYYLTSLVHLLGPIARVSGVARRSARERVIATGPNAGSVLPVDVDTHITALLEHACGVSTTVTISFEVWATRAPKFEVYGSQGTLAVPDPNRFSDPVEVFTATAGEWAMVPESAGYRNAGRGYGLADMVAAIAAGTPHRASAEIAFHVLDVMESILTAAESGQVIELSSMVGRPAAVPLLLVRRQCRRWCWCRYERKVGGQCLRDRSGSGSHRRNSFQCGVRMVQARIVKVTETREEPMNRRARCATDVTWLGWQPG